MKSLLLKASVFAAGAAFTSVFFINWCHLVYDCGCTFLWAGAADHCNIQQPGPPDCPLCTHGDLGSIAFFGTLAVQAIPAFWPGKVGVVRWAATLLASPLATGLIGWIIGRWVGYWP